ncbi:ADP-heptose:LPS heptosyltransferase [Persephonella hydrogeniphila]|uniref:ADP-heptose:LPS heptosyltransferase n=1 Tax=Persephonella hydrogeniphila TaxID=198703 RepID=A0A285NU50_9AQUI|nr:glycosyltransferase family 9 protein [Persephonella hydrogeniphila]SNZ11416.1 ADP-heptose:LPS heptosyltransferase [Persephonella hydrogeniphila]
MRVLVLRFSSLGDIILSSSVLTPLFEKGIEVDFLTFKPFDQLFKNDYRVKNVIAVQKSHLKTLKEIKNLSKELRDYDYIIDLHSNLRSTLLGFFTEAPVIRYRKNSIKRRLFIKPFFRKFIKEKFNVVEGYCKTLESLGIKTEKPRPEIILTEEEIKRVKKTLPDEFIVIGTGARYKNKVYPYFPEVSSYFLDSGIDVILIGTEDDKAFDRKKYPEKVIDLRGKLSIRESLSVIKNAKATISNDSAVAHMSRAVKTPVVVIYGATHPYFGFYPFEDEGIYISKNLKCQPCDLHGKKECKLESSECLDIEPYTVFSKALNLIKKSL